MKYDVKSPILGFEDMSIVKLEKIDDMFVTIRDANNENISLTLANPYLLREYSFDIPLSVKVLLNIKEDSKLSVYNVVVIQDPLDMSCINFLAPIVFNEDEKTVAQIILGKDANPEYKMAETIRSFRD